MELKQCSNCKQYKPFTEYNKQTAAKDGYSCWCRQCHRDWKKRKYHSDIAKSRANQIHICNSRLSRGLCRYCSTPQIPNSCFCEYHWFRDKAYNHLGSGNRTNINLLKTKLEKQNYTCPYTGEKLILGINCSLDHICPPSRFPELANKLDNVEWVTRRVNLVKGNMTKEEFIKFCIHIANHMITPTTG
jgi:hypothetical protein